MGGLAVTLRAAPMMGVRVAPAPGGAHVYLVSKHTILGLRAQSRVQPLANLKGTRSVIELTIPDLAASFEDGEAVFLGGCGGESTELSAALADPAARVANAHFVTSFIPGINGTCLARPAQRARMSVFFLQRSHGAALAEGRIEFRSLSYFGIHRYLDDPATRLDAAVVQVAPPDAQGRCSLGPSVEFMPTVIARVPRLLGIINPNVPRLRGAPSVPFERFSAIAHSAAALPTYEVGAPSDAAARVLIVNVEICSLHLQRPTDVAHALGLSIFGDGCAATLVTAEPAGLALDAFVSRLIPESADEITWRIGALGFEMHLSLDVPRKISEAFSLDPTVLLGGAAASAIDVWAVHPGGRAILDAVGDALALDPAALDESRRVLRAFGNMSSATISFVLARILRRAPELRDASCCGLAFGPGMVCETMRFTVAA